MLNRSVGGVVPTLRRRQVKQPALERRFVVWRVPLLDDAGTSGVALCSSCGCGRSRSESSPVDRGAERLVPIDGCSIVLLGAKLVLDILNSMVEVIGAQRLSGVTGYAKGQAPDVALAWCVVSHAPLMHCSGAAIPVLNSITYALHVHRTARYDESCNE